MKRPESMARDLQQLLQHFDQFMENEKLDLLMPPIQKQMKYERSDTLME